MITIAYLRRSCEDKAKQIQSIPKQKDWCEQTSAARGYPIDHWFTDTQSAKDPGRPEFNRMMAFVHASKEPVRILTWRISRLARNPVDEGAVKYAFVQNKIKHIHAGDREYTEGANQILMGVDFGEATEKSLQLSRDVTEGLAKKRAKGWYPCMAPLGYLNDPRGLKGEKRIFKDPERWDLLRQAWTRFLSGGYSVPDIKRWLDGQGFRTRSGKFIAHSTLHESVFCNLFYTGRFVQKGEVFDGAHTPMVSPTEFDRAQELLGRKDRARYHKHRHAFTGLIRCGECGCMITAEPTKYKRIVSTGELRDHNYMRCTKRKAGHHCAQKYIRLEDLEGRILAILDAIDIPESIVDWAIEELKAECRANGAQFAAKRAKLQKDFDRNEGMIEGLVDKLTQGIISDDIYQSNLERYKERSRTLKLSMASYEASKTDWLEVVRKDFSFAATAKNRFKNGSIDTRREILARLGSNHALLDGKLDIRLTKTLTAIQNANRGRHSKKPAFEPAGSRSSTGETGSTMPVDPNWSRWLDVVRKSLP